MLPREKIVRMQTGENRQMVGETQEIQTILKKGVNPIRNPYDVMDVPNPNDQEVLKFAANVKLAGSQDDENARAWDAPSGDNAFHSVEGIWFCRWNGGVDPTIPGDAKEKWKQ